jgi:hypothetical protein
MMNAFSSIENRFLHAQEGIVPTASPFAELTDPR